MCMGVYPNMENGTCSGARDKLPFLAKQYRHDCVLKGQHFQEYCYMKQCISACLNNGGAEVVGFHLFPTFIPMGYFSFPELIPMGYLLCNFRNSELNVLHCFNVCDLL